MKLCDAVFNVVTSDALCESSTYNVVEKQFDGSAMKAVERRQYILKSLQENGSVTIGELARVMDVSTMTVRRDLARMQDEGLLSVEGGGAILNGGSLFEFNMSEKAGKRQLEKEAIARACLELVGDGDSVMLDGGTTTLAIAPLISANHSLAIITNSLLIANEMAKTENPNVVLCPGRLRQVSMAFIGPLTDAFIQDFNVDVLFLGVEGLSIGQGVSVPDIVDGTTKRALVNHAAHVYVVADHTKFEKSYLYRIAPLRDIDAIVTDDGLDLEVKRRYEDAGVPVIRATMMP